MSFVYPSFLLALLSLAIPVLIHLFYFRRYKTVYFSNVRLLREVKDQTQRRSRLKHLLVLAMRMLALAALVLAFAQPFRAAKAGKNVAALRAISIYVDNSFSMSSLSADVPLLEKAKQRAREIVAAYGAEDKFQILTTDLEGRDQRLLTRDEALSRIGEIVLSHEVKTLSQVAPRQRQTLATGGTAAQDRYLISDFQRNVSDVEALRDSAIVTRVVPLRSVEVKNIAIDSVWFDAPVQMPNQTNALIVRVRNYGATAVENLRLTLRLDGSEKPAGEINIQAGAAAFDTVNITFTTTGWHQAAVKITDYPVTFDDVYYFSFLVEPKIDILSIAEGTGSRFVGAAFQGNAYFRYTAQAAGKIDYSGLADAELVVIAEVANVSSGLSAALRQYLENGGNLLFFPAAKGSTETYNVMLQQLQANTLGKFEAAARGVAFINYEEFIYRDVFQTRRDNIKLPETKGNFAVNRSAGGKEEVLLRYRDGGSYLSKFALGKGNLYLCASPLDPAYNSLVNNGEIFVPLLYKAALSGGRERPIAYFIGKENVIEITGKSLGGDSQYRLKGESSEFIPQQRTVAGKTLLTIGNNIRQAGYYTVDAGSDSLQQQLAFNYDRRESDLATLSTEELEKLLPEGVEIIDGTTSRDFAGIVSSQSKGTVYWKWCLLAALLFLLAETLLLRFWGKWKGTKPNRSNTAAA